MKNSEREVGFTRDLRNTRIYYYKKGQALRDSETELFQKHIKQTYDKELKKDIQLIQTIPASLIGKELKGKLSRTMKVVMSHTKEFNVQKKEAWDLAGAAEHVDDDQGDNNPNDENHKKKNEKQVS